MALKTLENIEEIGGFGVNHEPQVSRNGKFIHINHDTNTIVFTIQNGAIKENGVNGCQIDTIIETAKIILTGLNKNFPCEENEIAIKHLRLSLEMLRRRKQDRENRGVEGYERA